MDARQIRDMRALLATQGMDDDASPPKRVLKPTRGRPTRSNAPPLTLYFNPVVPDAARPLDALEEDLFLEDDLSIPPVGCAPRLKRRPSPEPPQPNLSPADLTPRRPTFGQRIEPVLMLRERAPDAAERLTLLGADGAPVGEVVLHTDDAPRFIERRRRRPFEALHAETPFFPEDLADDPRPRLGRVQFKAELAGSSPSAELAATFLLASLAARLASENAALQERLLSFKHRKIA